MAGSADLPLRLSISDDYLFTAYVDASYAVHEDMKSHSGMVYTAGGRYISSEVNETVGGIEIIDRSRSHRSIGWMQRPIITHGIY